MKIYHILREKEGDYDTYQEAVVYAESEDEARLIHPSGMGYRWAAEHGKWMTRSVFGEWFDDGGSWIDPSKVVVDHVGDVLDSPLTIAGVIVANFKSG
jgi:hypothetical protein